MDSVLTIIFCLLRSLETGDVIGEDTLHRLFNKLRLELGARWTVRESRRCLRAVKKELPKGQHMSQTTERGNNDQPYHVGEAWDTDSHGRLKAIFPVIGDGSAIGVADVELGQRASPVSYTHLTLPTKRIV